MVGTIATADPMPREARAEIDALLSRLEHSGCRFSRNGQWHSGADARTHLNRKLEAVEKKTSAKTTEAFIELAASRSSTTGTPYQVQCGDNPAMPSAAWLEQQLRAVRASTRGAGHK